MTAAAVLVAVNGSAVGFNAARYAPAAVCVGGALGREGRALLKGRLLEAAALPRSFNAAGACCARCLRTAACAAYSVRAPGSLLAEGGPAATCRLYAKGAKKAACPGSGRDPTRNYCWTGEVVAVSALT